MVAAKKVPIRVLEKYKNPMLNITEQEAAVGFKHVFQTNITKDSVGDRIRAPFGMFTEQETFIDNNTSLLMNHIVEYYK